MSQMLTDSIDNRQSKLSLKDPSCLHQLNRSATKSIRLSNTPKLKKVIEEESSETLRVYFFGGKTSEGFSSKGLYMFELIDGKWVLQLIQPKGNPPPSRYACGMCQLFKINEVAVFGGVHKESNQMSKQVLNDLFLFSVDTLIWTQLNFGKRDLRRKYATLSEGTENDLVMFGGLNEKEEGGDNFRVFRHISKNALTIQEKQLYFN